MTASSTPRNRTHFTIDDLRTRVIPSDGNPAIALHVQSLTAVATKAGLGALVDHFGPENVAVAIEFTRLASGSGVDVSVQASRWGFSARINVQLRLHPETLGAIQVSLSPARGWHPADLIMLGIIHGQIKSHASTRTEVVQTGSRSFDVDIQYLVHDVLSNGDIPVHWGAALSDVEPEGDEIRFHFTPVPAAVEASSDLEG